ncbi:Hypothetical_protein [Hexamita inflata]|uniref:Hypothetical_protein n=1 Tax=Hexamita inflata TaxID=28002 RepID=A0ABP1GHW5_9EUKA
MSLLEQIAAKRLGIELSDLNQQQTEKYLKIYKDPLVASEITSLQHQLAIQLRKQIQEEVINIQTNGLQKGEFILNKRNEELLQYYHDEQNVTIVAADVHGFLKQLQAEKCKMQELIRESDKFEQTMRKYAEKEEKKTIKVNAQTKDDPTDIKEEAKTIENENDKENKRIERLRQLEKENQLKVSQTKQKLDHRLQQADLIKEKSLNEKKQVYKKRVHSYNDKAERILQNKELLEYQRLQKELDYLKESQKSSAPVQIEEQSIKDTKERLEKVKQHRQDEDQKMFEKIEEKRKQLESITLKVQEQKKIKLEKIQLNCQQLERKQQKALDYKEQLMQQELYEKKIKMKINTENAEKLKAKEDKKKMDQYKQTASIQAKKKDDITKERIEMITKMEEMQKQRMLREFGSDVGDKLHQCQQEILQKRAHLLALKHQAQFICDQEKKAEIEKQIMIVRQEISSFK